MYYEERGKIMEKKELFLSVWSPYTVFLSVALITPIVILAIEFILVGVALTMPMR